MKRLPLFTLAKMLLAESARELAKWLDELDADEAPRAKDYNGYTPDTGGMR